MNASKLKTIIISLNVLIVICALIMTTYFNFPTKNDYEFLPIQDAFGPESLTFDPAGDGPYTGVSDGRILKWLPHQRRWVDFAFTSPQRDICGNQSNHEEMEYKCGRPLGLKFNEKTGELYIADAYLGLMVVGQEGGLATTVVTQVEGVPLGFTNGIDIDQHTGIVYFTCSSTRYPRRNYMSLILSKDTTGRLLKYDPRTKQATKLLDNLTFPNGVSLSSDGSFLLLVDTTNCNILRYCLQQNNPKAANNNKPQILAQLPGYADNIKRNSKGEYWVGIYSKRGRFLKWLLSFPLLSNTILNLPFNAAVQLAKLFVRLRSVGLAVKLDQNGNVLHLLQDTTGNLKFVSEVLEKDGNLWFGSVILPFATFYNHSHSLK